MTAVPRTALTSMLLRSFSAQGSWNYRTLIGCGFAFSLLPVLRVIYRDDPTRFDAAVRRHAGLFNSHPYVTPLALGAVTVLEGVEDPAVIERFKQGVRGSLGSLGDRLIWAGWRPVCLLAAVLVILLGVTWSVAVIGFLLLYNTGHVFVRVWSQRVGLTYGKRVGERLRSAPIERLQQMLQAAGTFLLGVLLPLIATGRLTHTSLGWPWIAAAAVAGLLGVLYGPRVRVPVTFVMAAVVLLGIIIGIGR